MDFIVPMHLEKIKNITAIFVIICCVIGLIGNVFIKGTMFNIILLSVVTLIFTITLFVKAKHSIIYKIQLIIIICGGISTSLFSENSYFLGDIIILTGILLAYIYRIIKTYSYLTIIPIIVFLAFLKSFSASRDIIITAISGGFTFFIWTLVKSELLLYIRESQRNESLARIGLNAGNFIHNMHLATAMRLIDSLESSFRKNDRMQMENFISKLRKWIREKVEMRHQIVAAVDANRTTELERIDIHKILEAVITTLYFDQKVFQYIKVQKKFISSDLYIDAIPFEIYYIFQNIMSNSVEAMLDSSGGEKLLTVETRIESKKMVIIICDTGPGFPLKKNGEPDLTSRKITGGYGTRYVNTLMQNYKGVARYTNNPEGGASVRLEFPRHGIKISILFQKLRGVSQ